MTAELPQLRDALVELFREHEDEITEEYGDYGYGGEWHDLGRRLVPESAADLVIRFLASRTYVIQETP